MPLLTPDESETDGTGASGGAWSKPLLAPMAPFLRWWLQELKAIVPPQVRRHLTERRLLVRASQREICIADPYGQDAQEVCHAVRAWSEADAAPQASGSPQRCDLLLESNLVLEHELELPLDAEASLRRVLAFSMDRYTPFNESDVLFDYVVLRRDSVARKLSLKLFVAQREAVKPVVQHLAALGMAAATMDVVANTENGRAGVNLLASEQRPGSSEMGRSEKALGLLALALLLVAVVSPFVLRQQAVGQLEARVEQLRQQVRQAEFDRTELNERIARMQLIQTRNSAMPAVLDILFELTRLVPDDAWSGQVAIKSGRVRLSGEANAASELLARLSNSSIFSDPKYEAPLTQNPKTGRERFVISLAIKGLGDGA